MTASAVTIPLDSAFVALLADGVEPQPHHYRIARLLASKARYVANHLVEGAPVIDPYLQTKAVTNALE